MPLSDSDKPIHQPNARSTRGSALAMFQFRNADGTTTADTTWYVMPDHKETELKDDTTEDTWENESGLEYSVDGKRSAELSGNLSQTDRNTKRLFVKVLRDQYVLFLKEMSIQKLIGVWDYCLFFGRCIASLTYKTPNGDVPFKIKGSFLPSSLTLDISTVTDAGTFFSSTAGSWTGTWSIPRGECYEIFSLS